VEDWKNGMMVECDNSTIQQFDNENDGRMEKWKNGKMELMTDYWRLAIANCQLPTANC
jgi:hypothetical protein